MNGSKRKHGLRVYGNQQKRRPSQWAPFFDGPEDNMAQQSPPDKKSYLAPPLPGNRPLSQKEAMMASHPDAAMVATVVEFTGCSPEEATRWLRVKHNSVEAATHAIFEGDDIYKAEQATTWDEGMFSADREGNEAGLHPLGTSPAPTRGPSPAPSLGLSQPTNRTQEDKDLEAAIRLSQQDNNIAFQQESGIVLSDGTEARPKFGPATREHYERDEWALVPTSTVAQEVVPDIDIEHRRNREHEPRLLKHLPDGDYTPNFITICQAIPIAREALLLRDSLRADYGQDSEWWRGHQIPMPRIVHTVDGSPLQPDSDAQEELISETQRLMAFLDGSARSYATIGGLTQTESIKAGDAGSQYSGTLLELFIKKWTAAAQAKTEHFDEVARLFTTKVGTTAASGINVPELSVVDLNVATKEGEKIDLSELLDELLWVTEPGEMNLTDNYIERPAEIIVMKLSHVDSRSTQLGVEIPAAIQLDKYLQENVAATRNIRQEIIQCKEYIQRIEGIEKKLLYWQHPTKGTEIEVSKLLQYTLDHYSYRDGHGQDRADGGGGAIPVDTRPAHYSEVAEKMEGVIARIDKKLELLAQEKDRARRAMAGISRTTFSEMESGDPEYHYTLRGVATKPNITYVLRPKDEHDEDGMLLQPDEESTPPDMQWWRLDYEVSGLTAKITKSKAADYDVLRAVELEHNHALLVYASAAASSADLYEPLPPPLHAFVRRDNDLFLADVRAAERRPPVPPSAPPPAYEDYQDVPRQSIERSSMDSTRAETGADSPPASTSVPDEPPPPRYNNERFESRTQFELGYDVKQIERADVQDPPVAEIRLSPHQETEEEEQATDLLGSMKEKEREMVQKANSPLFPVSPDARMSGTDSQDAGIGGNVPGDGDADVEMK